VPFVLQEARRKRAAGVGDMKPEHFFAAFHNREGTVVVVMGTVTRAA